MPVMSEILSTGLPRGLKRNKNGVRPEGSSINLIYNHRFHLRIELSHQNRDYSVARAELDLDAFTLRQGRN